MMRSVKTKQQMPALYWVFDGSRLLPDGRYAADLTGYVVSIVNFDLTMIDVPELASNANETLEWEYNPDWVPAEGHAGDDDYRTLQRRTGHPAGPWANPAASV